MSNKELYNILKNIPINERCIIIDYLEESVVKGLVSKIRSGLSKPLVGGALGGTLGTLGSAGVWAVKQHALQKMLKDCDKKNPSQIEQCKQDIKKKMEELKKSAVRGGAAAAAGGAALGTLGSMQQRSKLKNIQLRDKMKKEAETSEWKRKYTKEDVRARYGYKMNIREGNKYLSMCVSDWEDYIRTKDAKKLTYVDYAKDAIKYYSNALQDLDKYDLYSDIDLDDPKNQDIDIKINKEHDDKKYALKNLIVNIKRGLSANDFSHLKTSKGITESAVGGYVSGIRKKLSNAGTGAILGGAIGTLGSATVWAMKQKTLNNMMKDCDNLPPDKVAQCKDNVKKKIEDLKKSAMRSSAVASVAGAGIGGFAAKQEKDRLNAKKEAEEYSKKQMDHNERVIKLKNDTVNFHKCDEHIKKANKYIDMAFPYMIKTDAQSINTRKQHLKLAMVELRTALNYMNKLSDAYGYDVSGISKENYILFIKDKMKDVQDAYNAKGAYDRLINTEPLI